jgi:hypothetical protein
MMRAALCSRLAKIATGAIKRELYRLKNCNVRYSIELGSSAILISVDSDLFIGLLSVQLRGHPGLRIHTHENWLFEQGLFNSAQLTPKENTNEAA